MDIEYSKYSLSELIDIEESINREEQPTRYNEIVRQIEIKSQCEDTVFEYQNQQSMLQSIGQCIIGMVILLFASYSMFNGVLKYKLIEFSYQKSPELFALSITLFFALGLFTFFTGVKVLWSTKE